MARPIQESKTKIVDKGPVGEPFTRFTRYSDFSVFRQPGSSVPFEHFSREKSRLPGLLFSFFSVTEKYSLFSSEMRNPPYCSIIDCVKDSRRKVFVQT
jgi:hypothetical protein